jgi:N-methylhydantoinase B
MTHGAEVPNSAGIFGGHPGTRIVQRMGRAVLAPDEYPQARKPQDAASLGGSWQAFGSKPGMMPMAAGDVFAVSWQGGGGVGDPLERDPQRVWTDVLDGLISEEQARELYGVVGGDALDTEGSRALRDQLRSDRLGGREAQPGLEESDTPVLSLGSGLELHRRDGSWEVRSSGHVLARDTTAWRSEAVTARLEDPGLHPDLAVTAFYCPFTGRQLAVDVHERDRDPVDDVEIDLASLDANAMSARIEPEVSARAV